MADIWIHFKRLRCDFLAPRRCVNYNACAGDAVMRFTLQQQFSSGFVVSPLQ